MISNLVAYTNNVDLGLAVIVYEFNVQTPRTIKGMRAAIAKHVVDCKHCFAMALLRDEMLSDVGCSGYKKLLYQMKSMLRVRSALESGGHAGDDEIEEYGLGHLTSRYDREFDLHIAKCTDCARNLDYRMEFVICKRGAVESLAKHDIPEPLWALIGVQWPEAQLSVHYVISL